MFGESLGQSWLQLGELGIAFVLSALIGLEREIRQKAAGLRTYTLVGFSSALIMLISKYGFSDILVAYKVVLDPSRIAAQIVSGIGFIGGGVIFVRRDAVRGLTTAATVWLVAAVGMACGAGLPILAGAVTVGHFVTVFAFPPLLRLLPRSRWVPVPLAVSYEDGRGILRDVLVLCTKHDFAVGQVKVEKRPLPEEARAKDIEPAEEPAAPPSKPVVTVTMTVMGARSVPKLAAALSDIDGVVSVTAGEAGGNAE